MLFLPFGPFVCAALISGVRASLCGFGAKMVKEFGAKSLGGCHVVTESYMKLWRFKGKNMFCVITENKPLRDRIIDFCLLSGCRTFTQLESSKH